MMIPDRMAPISPHARIKISASANETILLPNAENESSGRWKYSINLTLSIIKIQTMG